MEQGEICHEDIVEVDLRVCPGVVEVRQVEAGGFIGNQRGVDKLTVGVDTAGELTAEQVHSHDAEYQPEDEADEKHVEDRRNRLDQRVYNHLHCAAQL